jgi:DNA-binding transcriptional regulator YhcF (GntR family)
MSSSVPPYEQLRRRIAAQIDAGELEVDRRLPTVRELARQTGLAVNTAAKSYRELESAGYIRTEGRRGTFVAARPGPFAESKRDAAIDDPVSFCMSSEMSLLRRDAFLDKASLDSWFDDDFVMVQHDGRLLQRPEALCALRTDASEAPTVEGLRGEPLGPSVVVLSYVTRRGSSMCRHSSIWVRGVAGWRCRCRQSTPVTC